MPRTYSPAVTRSGRSTLDAIMTAPKVVLTAKGRRKETPTTAEADDRSSGRTAPMRNDDITGQVMFMSTLRPR